MEILILHPGALGDVILAMPAISMLRDAFPSARLTLAGNVSHLDAVLNGSVDRTLSLSTLPIHRLFVAEIPSETDARFWKSYDRIVSWTGFADNNFKNNLKSIHPEALIASWKPTANDFRHVSRIFADSLGFETSKEDLSPPRIELDASVRDQGRRWLSCHGQTVPFSLTAIHPGSGGKHKRWPMAQYIELAKRLVVEEKRPLIIIEGPAEQGIVREILKAVPDPGIIPCEGADLMQLAGILVQCRDFIGNDSGVTHLAAALGVPCLALFGPTSPLHWAPRGDKVIVLRNNKGCRGCEASAAVHSCMGNISVENVICLCRQLQMQTRRD